ncbi:MAG: Asp-tRNA(Asn)/Glu-tRNA(Gln) amidotransferase GatCAB subunit A [Thermoprotei archaeon]|nr:MAG: Asp-tRNA(Asn)/Glu-tRNA(Gln) amidotransferase GatCAB subunit A [Thermoprotei archaeon]
MKYIYEPAYKLVDLFHQEPDKIFDYIDAVFNRIKSVESKVKSYITLRSYDSVLKEAEEVVLRIKKGEHLPLAGILIAVKDNISTRGLRTTCASRILENYVPPYDATVIKMIKEAGGIVVGKTNMDEFAMGSTTENSAFFPTHNPWDLTRVPGGSSGGSAAAISAGETTLALGSDTGGSIRCPAAFTATVGLKPTYGLVSRYGLIAYASSLDQIGPMARNVHDVALLLSIIATHDSLDSTSIPRIQRCNFLMELLDTMKKRPRLKIALVRELWKGVEEDVGKVLHNVLDKLCSEHMCEEVSIPIVHYALPAYYVIAMAEASSNLARYDGVRYGLSTTKEGRNWIEVFSEVRSKGFGFEVKKRIALGAFILSAGYQEQYYIRALKVRRILKVEFDKLFTKFDVIALPTMPIKPPRLGEAITDPIKLYSMDIDTVLANMIGSPAVSVPAGFANALPVAVQFMGKPLSETTLLYAASLIEEITKLHDLKPPL